MEQGFSTLMFIFAGVILLYAAVMAVTKDYRMLPLRARVSVKPKNPEKYMTQLAKAVALAAAGVAAGALVGLWNALAGLAALIICVAAALWLGTKLMKDVT